MIIKNKIWFVFFVLLFQFFSPSASVLAIDVAPRISDREVIEKLVILEVGQDALNRRITDLSSEMKSGQDALNRRITDLSSEMKSGQDALNRRITDLRSEMKSGQDALRSEMKSGLEGLNKRIDDINQTMLALFGAIMTLIVAIFAYIAWDRRTMVKPLINQVNQMERDLVNDFDFRNSSGSLLQRQLQALREYAGKNSEFAEILRGLALL